MLSGLSTTQKGIFLAICGFSAFSVSDASCKWLAQSYSVSAVIAYTSLFSVAGLLLSALLLPGEDGVIGLMAVFWITVWWSVILGVAWAAIRGFGRGLGNTVKSIGTLMFLIPFVFGGVAGPAMMFFGAGSTPLYLLVGTAVLLGIINLTFYYLLRAPTVPGRSVRTPLPWRGPTEVFETIGEPSADRGIPVANFS